jgi:hypothetical protein
MPVGMGNHANAKPGNLRTNGRRGLFRQAAQGSYERLKCDIGPLRGLRDRGLLSRKLGGLLRWLLLRL